LIILLLEIERKRLPFPYLHLLLDFDHLEFFKVLTIAFEDSCLNDTIKMWPTTVDLGFPDIPRKNKSISFFNRQIIIEILIRVILNPVAEFNVNFFFFSFKKNLNE